MLLVSNLSPLEGNQSPWLNAALEMNELLKEESEEVQERFRQMNRKHYPEPKLPSDDDFEAYLEDVTQSADSLLNDDEEPYPPFTGEEYLATHETIDDHPYAVAFGQFLGNGIDPDTANILAFGENRFDLISSDFNDPLRQRAFNIYGRFAEMGYWDEEEEGEDPLEDKRGHGGYGY